MSIQLYCRPLVCFLIVLNCVAAVYSQTAIDDLQIFARAGRVNHVIGSVQIRDTAISNGIDVMPGIDLMAGNRVETGANSKVEVLLNPGTFLRVGEHSEIQFLATKLPDVRLYLRRGSAVIETGNEPNQSLRIHTPLGQAFIESKGIFRINVLAFETEFLSLSGNLVLGSRKVIVSEGQRVRVNHLGAGPISRFELVAARDGLQDWSRSRAEFLAKANRNLDNGSLISALNREANNQEINAALTGQTGFWVISQVQGITLFVPFFPEDWRSPDGFQYSNGSLREPNRRRAPHRSATKPGASGSTTKLFAADRCAPARGNSLAS